MLSFIHALVISVLTSLSFSDMDAQQIMDAAIHANKMEQVFAKYENGRFQPLVVVTNGLIPPTLQVDWAGEPVTWVTTRQAAEALTQHQLYLEVTELKDFGRSAELYFYYGQSKVRMNFQKRPGHGWIYRACHIKAHGKRSLEVEF
jgi:hypothetical protein